MIGFGHLPVPIPDPQRPAHGLVTDVDGTLIDSNDAHAQAWAVALAQHDRPIPSMVIRPLVGLGGDRLLLALTGLPPDAGRGRRILARRREIFREQFLPRLRPFPGAPELLKALRARGLRIAVASAAEEAELDDVLQTTGIDTLIDARASSDDVVRSKPDPEVLRAALDRLQLAPEDALVLGDTPYDVRAARFAGIPAVALRCGGWDDRSLSGACAIFDDPADVLAHLEQAPLSEWLVDDQRRA